MKYFRLGKQRTYRIFKLFISRGPWRAYGGLLSNLFVWNCCLQVVEVLTESLTLKETPIPTKVARLMLVSDILHNSSAPVKNASAYRTKFEATLPDIMESFNDLYRSVTGRITAEALKVRLMC